MQEDEEILHGGNVNQIVRIRNTVHRTTNWNPLVKVLHTILMYLIFYLRLPIHRLYFTSSQSVYPARVSVGSLWPD
jgi:hypothetical protein